MTAGDRKETTYARRRLLVRVAGLGGRLALFTGILTGFSILRGGREAPPGAREPLGIVRPPGSLSETEFLSACIRCTRCADACETQCIRLFGPEAGALQGTPYIMPISRACNLCLACGPACPSGAIQVLERKEDSEMGLAVVDERLCVSHNGTGVCGACHTACPLRNSAITQELRNAPTVHAEHCTGCGLCEEHCIVDERAGVRAIQVTSDRHWSVIAGGRAT